MTPEPGRLAFLHGILFRSSFIILSAFLLTGLITISYSVWSTGQRNQEAADQRLNELLDTVESTVQVACFARDNVLATEVANGLLSNSEVQSIRILTGENVLAQVEKHNGYSAASAPRLHRDIFSPFDTRQRVGQIQLTPNQPAIQARIGEEISLIRRQFLLQLLGAAVVTIFTTLMIIVRPIKAISDALHTMNPLEGERLALPPAHQRTEIGRLIDDVNLLSGRLVNSLEEERTLRLQREMDEKKYHAIFDNAESGIFIVNRLGVITSWNRAFARLLEIADQESSTVTRSINDLTWGEPAKIRDLITSALDDLQLVSGDVVLQLADAHSTRWLNIVLSPIDEYHVQGVVHDVSELKASEADAQRQVVTDPLTGLVNRVGMEMALQDFLLAHASGKAEDFALLIVNLDGFKKINEGIGLPTGDEILKITRTRIRTCLKNDDLVGRLSGDIFAIVLQDIAHSEAIESIARRILNVLRQPYVVGGISINLHGSIGITLFPHDGATVPTLLRHAELAVDKAKADGGDTAVFFDASLAEVAEKQRQLEQDLRDAIERREFVLFYQPIIDLQVNRLAGAEALIRWQHPTRGLVPPDSFIPVAEHTGLINEIGLWSLQTACQQLAEWRDAGLDYYLSLNISGRQIPDGMPPETLRDAVKAHGIAPEKLCLEITEGVLLSDLNRSLAWLQAVHDLGFRIYLDDFGTGYSSLSYLKRFPVDTLKIDRSFVQDMAKDPEADGNDRTLVSAIVAMAINLGLNVVAEGVETAPHANALRRLGCHYAQGYHFSRPVPAEGFAQACEHIETLLTDAL